MTETLEKVKLQYGGFKYPVEMWTLGSRIFFRFSYNKGLKDEIKSMEGAKWEPEKKVWSIKDTQRNQFQLDFLKGLNPYKVYDTPLDLTNIPTVRYNKRLGRECLIYQHQREGIAHNIQRRNCIVAGEMGTGKSLMMGISLEIEAAKREGVSCWYVGPRSALAAVRRDFEIWGIHPLPSEWLTYEALTRKMKDWAGHKAPFIIAYDEASKLKNMTSQRSQAAKALADGIRQDWMENGIVSLFSGTPAPKSPADWWSLAEVARPGFLKEGDIYKFKNRLGVILQKEGIDGGSYPQLITWRNDSTKCDKCGLLKDAATHMIELIGIDPDIHEFIPSVNEVAHLYERLKGLVVVYFKKDCLSLPDKIYRVIEVKPTKSILRAAKIITSSCKSTIQGLIKLRELSDGFQYVETPTELITCEICKGTKEISHIRELPNTCPNCQILGAGQSDEFVECSNHSPETQPSTIICPHCDGKGKVQKYDREIREVDCPKDEALIDLLDEYEDVGRVVIYGGFTGTINRIVNICHRHGWWVIRMDQGKIEITDPKGLPIYDKDFQSIFQDKLEEYPKVAFVAHTESGGMGLTLTASPMICYFSNTFSGEARMQSEDRIHRIGLDMNRGATIIDILHLPSDKKVLENLQAKKDLQSLSMGEFTNDLDGGRSI